MCVHAEEGDLYPYLLVNIGSGVSMVKVSGEGQYERVSGSSLGGGTFSGLCRLLTQCRDFDEMLQLSMQGDNSKARQMECVAGLSWHLLRGLQCCLPSAEI